MGPQQELAKTIRDQDTDDGLALNGHQGMVHADGTRLFAWADAPPSRDVGHQTDETHHAGHGREERRRTTVTTDLTGRRGYERWMGVQTVAMVEAWRTQGDAVAYARRDDLSRLGLDATQRAERGRGHGAIEPALHGVLDIALGEDDSRMRQGHAPRTLRHAPA